MTQRVEDAYAEKWETMSQLLKTVGVDTVKQVFFRAFKEEKSFEVWIQKGDKYVLLKEYPICTVPGVLGPKRKEGDHQVPEGCYFINVFNPASTYHLSLGINYPNASDSVFADSTRPGSEIYIHGDCVSVGCIPLTDSLIKEVYLWGWEAKKNGQTNIPVHIFPFRMSQKRLQLLSEEQRADATLLAFWGNLQKMYLYFEENKQITAIQIDKSGKYLINP